jgi:cell division protein FtsB
MNKLYCTISSLMLPVIILLAVFQFILSNDLASVGAAVEKMDTSAESTKEENQILERQIATLRSLDRIEAKAKENGFIKATTFLTITDSQSVALR